PELSVRLLRGADAFDSAAYSHRPATAEQADDLLRLAEYIAESTPDLSDLEDGGARAVSSGAGSRASAPPPPRARPPRRPPAPRGRPARPDHRARPRSVVVPC